jgi:hypothetical protein
MSLVFSLEQHMSEDAGIFPFELNTQIENINKRIKRDEVEPALLKIVSSGCYTNLRDPTTFFLENIIKLERLKNDWLMSDSNDIKIINDIIDHIRYKMVYLESSICKKKISRDAIQLDIINATIDFRKYLQIRHDYHAGHFSL